MLKIEYHAAKTRLTHKAWRQIFAKQFIREQVIAERRSRQLMLDDSRGLYLSFRRDFPGLEERIRQIHIASYLGVSPVSLSRLKAAVT